MNSFWNWLKGLTKSKPHLEQDTHVSPHQAIQGLGGNPFQSVPQPPPSSAMLFTAQEARDLRSKEELSLLEVQTIIDLIRDQARNRNAPNCIVVDELSFPMQVHLEKQNFELRKGYSGLKPNWTISW